MKGKHMSEKKIGIITHYFDHISVGIIKAASPIKVGDKVHFKGHTTDFEQEIKEMQFDHESIAEVKKGKEVGVKVKEPVREGDEVFGIK
jgi:translation elongation factor EF-1alpha